MHQPVVQTSPRLQRDEPIVGVLGAKGGVGATTTAINLALAFGGLFNRCTLVDANLQQPDIAASLDLAPAYTLLDMINKKTAPDADVLQTCTTSIHEAAPHCRLLTPPRSGEAGLHTNLTIVSDYLSHLRKDSPCWTIDLPKHLDRHLVTMLDMCDQIVLVFEPTLIAVNSVKRWLTVFDELGYDRRKVCLVLNRSGGRMKGVEDQLDKVFADAKISRIPNAYGLVEKCSTAGEPVLARHAREPYSQAIEAIAQRVARGALELIREDGN